AAGLSLLGLLASSSDLIRSFGEAGFLATAIALATVLSLVPALGMLLIRKEGRFVATIRTVDPGVTARRRFCAWIALRMVSHPAAFSLAGFVAVACLSIYRGRDAHCWAPPAQIRTGPIQASGSYLGCLTSKRMSGLAVRGPAPGSRAPGSGSGACFADPRSPRSPALAPPAPRPVARLCSSASRLLCRSLTSLDRASAATAPHLPTTDHATQ